MSITRIELQRGANQFPGTRKKQLTHEEVLKTLLNPQGRVDRSSITDIHTEVSDGQPRLSTGLLPSETMYRGRFYRQGNGTFTCMAWAIIHGFKTIGIRPDAYTAQDLLNEATVTRGMSFNTAISVARRQVLQPAIFEKIDERGKDLRNYARLIQGNVTDTSSLIAIVRSQQPTPDHQLNAVCIAGYRVDEHGYMDLQIIDASRGVYREPLENFMRRKIKAGIPLVSIRKKSQKR